MGIPFLLLFEDVGNASFSQTLGGLTASSTAELDLSGASTATLEALGGTLTGELTVMAAASATLDTVTLSVSSTTLDPISGNVVKALEAATLSAAALIIDTAESDITFDSLMVAAVGGLTIQASSISTLEAASLVSASVHEARTAAVAATLDTVTLFAKEEVGGEGMSNLLGIGNLITSLR